MNWMLYWFMLPVCMVIASAYSPVAALRLGYGAAVLGEARTLTAEGGLSSIPWDLTVWSVPGSMIGAVLGTRLQGKVSEQATRLFFSALFALIGVTFLSAFTVFKSRFR